MAKKPKAVKEEKPKAAVLCPPCKGRGRMRQDAHPFNWLAVCEACKGSGHVYA